MNRNVTISAAKKMRLLFISTVSFLLIQQANIAAASYGTGSMSRTMEALFGLVLALVGLFIVDAFICRLVFLRMCSRTQLKAGEGEGETPGQKRFALITRLIFSWVLGPMTSFFGWVSYLVIGLAFSEPLIGAFVGVSAKIFLVVQISKRVTANINDHAKP